MLSKNKNFCCGDGITYGCFHRTLGSTILFGFSYIRSFLIQFFFLNSEEEKKLRVG